MMTSFSPKVEIINHFDKLIDKVDIDIEESIVKYNEQQILGELLNRTKKDKTNHWEKHIFNLFILKFTSDNQYQTIEWSESTKVIDYLTQVRMETIELLRKEQENCLENYRLHSSRLKSDLTTVKNIDELRSKLFAHKFHFQIHFAQSDKRLLWPMTVFTFVTDFYMSSSDEIFFRLFDGLNSFPNLLKLRFLKMGCYMTRQVNKKFLNRFPMLRELIVERCNIEKIKTDTFSNLRSLVRLDLSGNLLETLDLPIFSQLDNLEHLILRKNRIRSIESNVFSNLKKLQTLDLSDNELSILDIKSLVGIPNSTII